MTVQQALKYVEILSAERPASQVFLPKLDNAYSSFSYVERLLDNRISVAEEGNYLYVKRQLQDEELIWLFHSLPLFVLSLKVN